MKRILKNNAVQSLLASLACIIFGLLIGYIVLLFINPAGAWDAILTVIKNFFYYPSKPAALKYFGSTLVKTVPLMLCGLSVLFAYKVGLFNIGAAGQYVAGAGAALTAAALAAQRAGLSGMEPLSGIPGTCGGAVYMNAGAYGGEISAVLKEAALLAPDGTVARVPAGALRLGYRRSRMMETGEIVLEAVFSLAPGNGAEIAAAMRSFAAKRREKQPVTLPSAGSFFKRPEGHFAGALIEAAGLKGARVGGAEVSTLHAGFLVNAGGATAQDFLDLSALVVERVYKTSGVTLEPEVRII